MPQLTGCHDVFAASDCGLLESVACGVGGANSPRVATLGTTTTPGRADLTHYTSLKIHIFCPLLTFKYNGKDQE